MSMKNSNDTIENRSHDLPACSTVPQPLRHHLASPDRDNITGFFTEKFRKLVE
jgi:hypothetical protein